MCRQLEASLQEAHDSIKKRFPDSIANLLYIEQQQQQQLQREPIAQLKEELAHTQEKAETRIRALRQVDGWTGYCVCLIVCIMRLND